MARATAKERREALRNRTSRGVSERNIKGSVKKSVLDFSKTKKNEGDQFEVTHGKKENYIDIIPFEITQDWYKTLLSVKGSPIGLEVGYVDYKLEVPIHKGIGENNDVFLCLKKAFGKKCPICEELREEYNKSDEDQDEKKISALSPKWRCFYNIYDYNGDSEDIKLWDFSYHLFEKKLQTAIEEESDGIAIFSDLEEGSSIKFKGTEKFFGKYPYVKPRDVSFVKRDIYEESIIDSTFPLDAMLKIPTYEEVYEVHFGEVATVNENESNEKVEEKSAPQRKQRTRSFGNSNDSKNSESAKPERTRGKTKEEDNNESQENKCPQGKEFGVDCDPDSAVCSECDEDTFQECSSHVTEKVETPASGRRKRRGTVDQDLPF